MNFNSFLGLMLIILANILILLMISFFGVKFGKLKEENLINIQQYFFTMLSTVVLCFFFSTILAAFLYIALFFLYRNKIFRKNAFRIQEICQQYDEVVHLAPPIKSFSSLFRRPPVAAETENLEKIYLYKFEKYSNQAIYIFIFYCLRNTAGPENALLYGFEFFIAITALFIVLAKVIYHLSLFNPGPFYLCPNLSYIPVVFGGLLFYGIATFMFLTTL